MRPPDPSDRLSYRALERADTEAMHVVWGDRAVMRYLPSDPSPSVAETAEPIERPA